MADNRRFVQFSHPGREHEPDPGGVKGWNTYASPHARKFMEFRGKWIEEDGSARSGGLRAWGEWEAESDLVCELNQPLNTSLYPRYLWRPYCIPRDTYERLHNTDPFIFGERFPYSNFKQRQVSGLARLGRSSVIAFGSGRKIAGDRKWLLAQGNCLEYVIPRITATSAHSRCTRPPETPCRRRPGSRRSSRSLRTPPGDRTAPSTAPRSSIRPRKTP